MSRPIPLPADRHRFWLACGGATLFHLAVLFGVHISDEPSSPVSLEVTLLATPGSRTPVAAKILAPVASIGGGQRNEMRAPATQAGSAFERAGLIQAADLAMRAATQQKDGPNILTAPASEVRAQSGDQNAPHSGADPALLLQRREQMGQASSSQQLNNSQQPVSTNDAGAHTGLTTRAARQAAYRELWRRRIEQAGSANFPWSALTTGQPKSLTLLVTVRMDGAVSQTRVIHSSGLPALDKAALDILRMAAPFPPFPDDLRRETSELSFIHVWEFLPGDRASLRIGR